MNIELAQLSLDSLTKKLLDFGVHECLAPLVAIKYKEQYTEGPYSTAQVVDQINGLIQEEVNKAVSALIDEGRCFLTTDDEGRFHVGRVPL